MRGRLGLLQQACGTAASNACALATSPIPYEAEPMIMCLRLSLAGELEKSERLRSCFPQHGPPAPCFRDGSGRACEGVPWRACASHGGHNEHQRQSIGERDENVERFRHRGQYYSAGTLSDAVLKQCPLQVLSHTTCCMASSVKRLDRFQP